MIEIKYIDPIWSRISKDGIPTLKGVLYYKDTYWRQGPHRKIQKEYHHILIGKDGKFLTGFLPRIHKYLTNKGVNPEYIYQPCKVPEMVIPKFFYSLRPEQLEAVKSALSQERGVIHYPTGSGKTIIFLSIIQCFPEVNALILLHRQDLLYQTYEKANEIFPGEIGIIGDGKVEPNRITIAMVQTLSKMLQTEFHKKQGVIIVDETHYVNSFSGEYYKTLILIPAPIRLGFTATLPYTEKGRMALEGLIGPVIAEKKIQEVQSLAKIIIKLKKLPFSQTVHDLRTWKDVYKMGVVFNSRRHRIVLEDTIELINQGRTVLILVVEIEHGHNLIEMAKKRFPNLKIQFIWGNTSTEDRIKVKKLLDSKQVNVVIANSIWKEGIDIPSLGAIINAAGGKSEIMTIQSLGRGLRTTEEKKDVILRDYFDPSHKFLVEHFGHRITLYFSEEWL